MYAEDCVLEDPVGPSMFDPEGRGHRGHAGLSAFWKQAIAPIDEFEFEITDSFANPGGNTCANVGRIRTSFPDGSHTTTDLIMVYVVDDDGRVASMRRTGSRSARWRASRQAVTCRRAPRALLGAPLDERPGRAPVLAHQVEQLGGVDHRLEAEQVGWR